MTELRILNVVVWALVAVYMAPGAYGALGKRPRRGDAMRLACFVTSLIMAGFSLRWLLLPNNDAVWQALYVLAAGDGCYIAWLARTYGRGPHV